LGWSELEAHKKTDRKLRTGEIEDLHSAEKGHKTLAAVCCVGRRCGQIAAGLRQQLAGISHTRVDVLAIEAANPRPTGGAHKQGRVGEVAWKTRCVAHGPIR